MAEGVGGGHSRLPSGAFQRVEQFFEAVDLYFVDGGQQHAEFPLGEPLPVESFQVRHGEVADQCVLVFAEWHRHGDEGLQQFRVGLKIIHYKTFLRGNTFFRFTLLRFL